MKIIIKDVDRNEVFTTEKVKDAYEFLKKVIPAKNLSSIKQIQNAINYDKNATKKYTYISFYINEQEKQVYRMEVTYGE